MRTGLHAMCNYRRHFVMTISVNLVGAFAACLKLNLNKVTFKNKTAMSYESLIVYKHEPINDIFRCAHVSQDMFMTYLN